MAANACLKNEFTEDEKCHNLMIRLKWEGNTHAKEGIKYKTQAKSIEGNSQLRIGEGGGCERGCGVHSDMHSDMFDHHLRKTPYLMSLS